MKLAALTLATVVLSLAGTACNRDKAKTETSSAAVSSAAAATPGAAPGAAPPAEVVETVPASCSSSGIKGNGEITRTKRDAKGFVDVVDNGSAEVEIKEGPFAVEVETDSNVQDSITTVASGKSLQIGGKGTYCTNKLKIHVTLPLFHSARVEGSGKVDATKTSAASDVLLAIDGSGRITFRGTAASLATHVNGSGAIMLESGAATSTQAMVNGSGSVKKTSFTPGTISKQVNGSGAVAL